MMISLELLSWQLCHYIDYTTERRGVPRILGLAPGILDQTCNFGLISLIKAKLPIRELPQSKGKCFDSAFLDSTLKILLNLATNELFFFIKKYKRKKSALSNCHEKFFFWIYYLDVHPYSIFTIIIFSSVWMDVASWLSSLIQSHNSLSFFCLNK